MYRFGIELTKVLLAILVFNGATSDAQENLIPKASDWSKVSKLIDAEAARILEQQHIPGLAIVVVDQGKTVIKRGCPNGEWTDK